MSGGERFPEAWFGNKSELNAESVLYAEPPTLALRELVVYSLQKYKTDEAQTLFGQLTHATNFGWILFFMPCAVRESIA